MKKKKRYDSDLLKKMYKECQDMFEKHNLFGNFWFLGDDEVFIFTRCPESQDIQDNIEWLEFFAEIFEDKAKQARKRMENMELKLLKWKKKKK
jgi:hypothetical protein